MSTVTIALSPSLDAALTERVRDAGAPSREEYLISLLEADCGVRELDRVLAERVSGSFAPLESDWKERVRALAARRASE